MKQEERKMATVLHITGEIASSQMKSDIASINRFEETFFQNLIEIVFDFLLSSKHSDTLLANLTELSAEIGQSLALLKNAVRSFLALLRAAGRQGTTAEYLEEDLTQLGMHLRITRYPGNGDEGEGQTREQEEGRTIRGGGTQQ